MCLNHPQYQNGSWYAFTSSSNITESLCNNIMVLIWASWTTPDLQGTKIYTGAIKPIANTPLHKGYDLCASLVRPQNWQGRRWRHKGGRKFALVVQEWYTGRSDISKDAMVTAKFGTSSKQSHKGCRGGQLLTGRSREAGGRHTHRRVRRMDTQRSAIGRPVKMHTAVNIVCQFERCGCLPWPNRNSGVHYAIIGETTVPPFGDHGNPWATMEMILPLLCLLMPLQQFWLVDEGTEVVR